jgi:hypothetical protein
MAFDLPLNPKYTWGDAVKVKISAPNKFCPGKTGSICGITPVYSSDLVQKSENILETIMYLVEFNDGLAIEIPEEWLDIYN